MAFHNIGFREDHNSCGIWKVATLQTERDGTLLSFKMVIAGTVDLSNLFQCCEKHNFGKLTGIFHFKISLLSSVDELFAMQ